MRTKTLVFFLALAGIFAVQAQQAVQLMNPGKNPSRALLERGMRQAGVLAAAGIVALEKMIDRLADDHANARRLAEGLADMPGFIVDLDRVQTNIVFFELDTSVQVTADVVTQRMLAQGVKLFNPGAYFRRFRAVTHAWVTREEIDHALRAFRNAVKN